jgi:hypothetical protein
MSNNDDEKKTRTYKKNPPGFAVDMAREYFRCWNYAAAYVRAGGVGSPNSRAFKIGQTKEFLDELDRLKQATDAMEMFTPQDVVANLLREANYYGPDGQARDRVKANEILGKINGLIKTGTVTNNDNRSVTKNVLLLPPMEKLGSWSAIAKESQRLLMQENEAES